MAQEHVIRALLADDYDILRSGLILALRPFPDIRIVGEAATGEAAVEQCATLHPHIILMDLIMPGMGGVEACRVIREQYPETRIIALTSYDNEALVQATVRAQISGYLIKNVSAQRLADVIRAVHRGEQVFADEAVQALVQASQRPTVADFRLTEREQEVLRLLVNGATNYDIAQTLVISESTAKKHVSAVLEKLGVHSRSEAIALVLRTNLEL